MMISRVAAGMIGKIGSMSTVALPDSSMEPACSMRWPPGSLCIVAEAGRAGVAHGQARSVPRPANVRARHRAPEAGGHAVETWRPRRDPGN